MKRQNQIHDDQFEVVKTTMLHRTPQIVPIITDSKKKTKKRFHENGVKYVYNDAQHRICIWTLDNNNKKLNQNVQMKNEVSNEMMR